MKKYTINALPCVNDSVGSPVPYSDTWKAAIARLATSAATLMPVARMRTRDGYLGNNISTLDSEFCWAEHNIDSYEVYLRENPWGTLVCVPKVENTPEYHEGLVVTPKWIEDCWDLLDEKHRYYAAIIEGGIICTDILSIITGLSVCKLMCMVDFALKDEDNVSSKILLSSIYGLDEYDIDSPHGLCFNMVGFFTYMVVRHLEDCGDIDGSILD